MSHQWFWQTEGEQYGPLSTEELEDLVRRNRVKVSDEIRLDGTADWLPAGQVIAMFAGPVDDASTGTAAKSAAYVLSNAARMRLGVQVDEESARGEGLGGLLAKGVRGIAGLAGLGRNLVAWFLSPLTRLFSRTESPAAQAHSRASRLRQSLPAEQPAHGAALTERLARLLARVTRRFGRTVTLGVIAAGLLIVPAAAILKNVEFRETQTPDAQLELTEAWDEIQAMKQRGASQAEWEEYEEETLSWLKPMLKELGETATKNQSASGILGNSGFNRGLGQQQLVSAGWVLRDIISDARKAAALLKSGAGAKSDEGGTSGAGATGARNSRTSRLMTFPTDPPDVMFSKRMAAADAYLTGNEDTLRPAHVAAPAFIRTKSWARGALITVGCIVAGSLGWWWKRRR